VRASDGADCEIVERGKGGSSLASATYPIKRVVILPAVELAILALQQIISRYRAAEAKRQCGKKESDDARLL
jgi:hypothetical protein